MIKYKKILSDLFQKKENIKLMKTPKTTRNNPQTAKKRQKQLVRTVSLKRLKTMIWKRKTTTKIATLKARQSYSKRIQIRFNTVKAQMFIILRS